MASEAVLKYLVDTNRPYSCADVTVNLRGAFTKTAIQKALDALSETGKIKCKLYGKQKVYAAIQLENTTEDNDREDYDTQLKTITQNLAEKSSLLKTIENNYKNLIATPTTEGAKTQIDEIRQKIDGMEKKLDTLRTSTEVLSAEEKKSILDEHNKQLREYRKRKRISSDMLDALLDGPKPKKTLIEELCIETDEMVDFKLMSS